MKKAILNLGEALNKTEQQTIKGGTITCFEWCALDPMNQASFDKPLYCNCNNSGGSGGNDSRDEDGPANAL